MKREYMPFPELVEPLRHRKSYRVEASEGYAGSIDLIGRLVRVPDRPLSRSVCRHEYGHARFSPPKLPDIDFPVSCLQVVEDARVNLGLAALGTPVEMEGEPLDQVLKLSRQDLRSGNPATFFLRCVASIGTEVLPRILEDAPRGNRRLIKKVREQSQAIEERLRADAEQRDTPEAHFDVGLELARELADRLDEDGTPPPDRMGACACVGSRPGRGRRWKDDVSPGRMSLVHAPADQPLAPGRCPRAPGRATEEGSVVRHVHRWSLDGRIFRRRARRGAGTLLIDVSGSMSLSSEEVDRIVRDADSALTVAIYSGKGDVGEVKVIVYGGRRASSRHLTPYGRGNVIDLPALQWLAKQATPRVWLSDGGVTGVGDQASRSLSSQCKAVCRAARIRRVSDVSEAAQALRA